MSLKINLFSPRIVFIMIATSVTVAAVIVSAKQAFAQSPPAETRSIEAGTDAEKKAKLKAPSYMTREERLNAKPLDWKVTSGKPKPRKMTAAERKVLRDAKPEESVGGAPAPNAEEEARKQHPDDWK